MSARENLTLGRPDASEADIAEAIEVAQAQFVYDLPWGLDTRIGEQGMSLSGGQRQRLALARAVLAKPRVLVLDDTLSALDIHTEALVEEALKRVLVGRDRTGRRAPRVDGDAGRPGGPAARAARSPTSAPTPSCWRRCPSTASCCPPSTPRRCRHECHRSHGQPAPRTPSSATGTRAGAAASRSGAGSPPSTTTRWPTAPAGS